MRILFGGLLVCAALCGTAASHPPPGFPTVEEIAIPRGTSPERIKLVKLALETARKHRLNNYIYGSADPARGGFDCSGSVYFLLRKMDIRPPRSSATQFAWIEKAGNLKAVSPRTTSFDAVVFDDLKPGDLLFWSGTYQPKDGRINRITHVQMYLGRDNKTGSHVMIGSTDGRTYRGTRRTGFGVFDFRLPRASSKARFVGYGTPPGLVKKADPPDRK